MSSKKAVIQVCKEFWFPLAVACSWAIYEWANTPNADRTLSASIKAFGSAFFFVSWLLSQWFRINKQQKVEGGLSIIEASVNKTLSELEARTKDLSCYITGGESVCYFDLADPPEKNGHLARMALRHQGTHPLYEISVRISDCDADFAKFGAKPKFRQVLEAGRVIPLENLSPRMVSLIPIKLELGEGGQRHFHMNFYARNGSFKQILKFQKIDRKWLMATQVIRNKAVVYEKIPDGFPMDEQGNIAWDGVAPLHAA